MQIPFAAISDFMIDLTVDLGGVAVGLSLAYDNYKYIFEPLATGSAPQTFAFLPEDELHRVMPLYPGAPNEGYVESMELCRLCCDALLPFERAVFHALSFMWRGKAWLLTAPSGTGKSTHYVLWKLRYGDEIQLMNGDKPVLDASGETIAVCPSPWYGKEGMHQMLTAPLGGVIILEQAQENSMRRITVREAVGRIFSQFLFSAENAEQLEYVSKIETKLLESVPVWLLRNRGDTAAAELCHDTISKELKLE